MSNVSKVIQYKIINRDGLFSTGGMSPTFNKTGYIWNDIKQLKNHLSLFKYGKWDMYKGCKIVSYEVIPMDEETVSLDDIFDNQKADAIFNKLKGNK